MKPRTLPYGDKNICGANIERIRKETGLKQLEVVAQLQVLGIDINPSSYSKLEGQRRMASDIEVQAIARILNVPIEELFAE
ncbi:MAG: helix-turn-helix transcriptional regulator [Oscillospiraceae bacterium]|nr:helix-turn-helix transcriptional regulator [Oscillospiraceae bacterium]